MMKKMLLATAACVAFAGYSAGASAQGAMEPSTSKILDLLVKRQLITQEDADALLEEARGDMRNETGTVRVEYVPEYVREEIKAEVKQEVVAQAKEERWIEPRELPSWIDRLDFYGDVRFRSENNIFPDDNEPFPDFAQINDRSDDLFDGFRFVDLIPLLNNTEDEYLLRLRARFGVDVDINSFTEAGFRFVSAADDNPISTNEVLTAFFDEFIVGFDRAYIRVRFQDIIKNDNLTDLSFWGGKFENPFMYTDIMFDDDLQFDGAAMTAGGSFWNDRVGVFGAGGAFPLNNFSLSTEDQWLYAGQVGFQVKPTERLSFKVAGAYYIFDNIQAQLNEPNSRDQDITVPTFFQKGNTLFNVRNDQPATANTLRFGLASEFEVSAVTAEAVLTLTDKMDLMLTGEYLKNQAFDSTAFGFIGDPLNPNDDQFSTGDDAWQVALQLGHRRVEKALDWRIRAAYKEMESDATVDAFVDSVFGLGGTNQEGFEIEGLLGVGDNLWLQAKWLSARSLFIPDPRLDNGGQFDVDTVQFDLTVRF